MKMLQKSLPLSKDGELAKYDLNPFVCGLFVDFIHDRVMYLSQICK